MIQVTDEGGFFVYRDSLSVRKNEIRLGRLLQNIRVIIIYLTKIQRNFLLFSCIILGGCIMLIILEYQHSYSNSNMRH